MESVIANSPCAEEYQASYPASGTPKATTPTARAIAKDRQLRQYTMITYTAKTPMSSRPVDRTVADRPSSRPAARQARHDGRGVHSRTATAAIARKRKSVSAMIRCSSSISNPS